MVLEFIPISYDFNKVVIKFIMHAKYNVCVYIYIYFFFFFGIFKECYIMQYILYIYFFCKHDFWKIWS